MVIASIESGFVSNDPMWLLRLPITELKTPGLRTDCFELLGKPPQSRNQANMMPRK